MRYRFTPYAGMIRTIDVILHAMNRDWYDRRSASHHSSSRKVRWFIDE
jgi:hypothetical protein